MDRAPEKGRKLSRRRRKTRARKRTPGMPENPRRLLEKLEDLGLQSEALVHVERIPPRRAQYGRLSSPLPEALTAALAAVGITRLYTHQAHSLETVRARKNAVVATGTASGKTYCYLLPVLEGLLVEPSATALLLFPTKALAQDQLKGIGSLQAAGGDLLAHLAGTYDGDTPSRQRSKLRDEASIILTNPDMLHSGILPNHARWARFLSNLRYVVCDEIHVYRGIFGSNVANVMRRLRRICRHYGADPRFICSSATIANPRELAERVIGATFRLIDRDGSPRGPKHFALWNPPVLSRTSMDRRSANLEARDLVLSFLRDGFQAITFVRARQTAEVLMRYCQEELSHDGGGLASRVRAYRGGYLPEERRAIEQELFSGELLGVISTNALELGIDVGSLDLALLVGFPGTIASTWQQAGRAGRTEAESLAVLIGHNTPIDQYLMRHPGYFFSQTPENAVVDPDNAHILLGHLRAAAYELPITPRDEKDFGEYAPAILDLLAEHREVHRLRGRWYYSRDGYPAADIGLRNGSSNVYVIVDTGTPGAPPFAEGARPHAAVTRPQPSGRLARTTAVKRAVEKGYRVIGTLDEASAYTQLYPQAIYMHDAETYMVEHLDLTEKVAYVHKVNLDYYTQSIVDSRIRIVDTEEERTWRKAETAFGPLAVSEKVYLFKKIRFGTRESVGFGPVDLPVQTLETVGFWITPPASAMGAVARCGRVATEGLCGIANVLADVITLHAMCDVMDIGTTQDSRGTGAPAIFVYDKYPGGLGFSQKAFGMIETLMQGACELITACPCEAGCPSCVGAPVMPHVGNDPDAAMRGRIPDKEAALVLLHHMLEKEPYVPKGPARAPAGKISPGGEDLARDAEPASREVKPLPPEVERRLRASLRRLGSGLHVANP